MMKTTHQYMTITLIVVFGLTACSKQNWYQGMQSAQTANCLKEPAAEYNDCKRRSDQNYDDYEKNREKLIQNVGKED